MELITAKEAAEKWGVTPRRVQWLCSHGNIAGAVRFGPVWMIPADAPRPEGRKKKQTSQDMPFLSPFLDMTSLYCKAGAADESAAALSHYPEAQLLYESQIACRRGDMHTVYDRARYFLASRSGFYGVLGGGMLLAQCAVWRGDVALWNEAKRHICEAPSETEQEREIMSLILTIIDSCVYNSNDYPDWFAIGNFECLPPDSHPSAKVYYVKYLYMAAYGVASKAFSLEGVQGLALMRMIPNTIEPLITQAVVDRTVLVEIYLRLSCAVAYHNAGEKGKAYRHMDKAIALALPDRLYGVLTEYVRLFDGVLEERIALVDPAAAETVAELYRTYSLGWAKLSGTVRQKYIATNLTPREREVAKLTAFGFSVKEIAGMLYVSESTIKQTISRTIRKSGIHDKSELAYIL